MPELDLKYEAERSLDRLRPKIIERIKNQSGSALSTARLKEIIDARLEEHWEDFFELLFRLYGHYYDFFYYLENILMTAVDSWLERPESLHALDRRRENDPHWYESERMIGCSLYVDLFNDDLNGLRERIPYLKDLGITYLHLMPLFAVRAGNSDGGYAISDYRSVNPDIGTIEQLKDLAHDLREVGISLVLDFVFNHTADDHEWAIRAQEGDRMYQDYYYTFQDRTLPDLYEQNLREIFPTIRRGNFSWHEGMKRWVWTTFNSFQWDLNYSNPEVFRAMAGEMLFLANTGVEILRLDAVAFIWKRMGTNCENLPEAHLLIQAFNKLCRIAAPSLVFKSEAIVHPDEVIRYISPDECQISYNPSLMALLWESLATRETKLLRQSLSHRQFLHQGTVWVNYLRGHDDIGWAFDDGDAWNVGINPSDHREFLNRFYTGRFLGSFACGVPFQHNETTGDMRISGTMGSLVGLEEAIVKKDKLLLEMAIQRLKMVYSILVSVGGIPLIFMGEEWGLLNDYRYEDDENKADDSRWVHRPHMDWSLLSNLNNKKAYSSRIFNWMQDLFRLRKSLPALMGNQIELLKVPNDHLLAYKRWNGSSALVVVANFSERRQVFDLSVLREMELGHFVKDLFSGNTHSTAKPIELKSFEFVWLEAN